jgi:hypothetical protein
MTYLVIALVVIAVAALVAWDIRRSKRKREAPKAGFWFDTIGFESFRVLGHAPFLVRELLADVEAFTGRKLTPVVVIVRPDPIKLPTGGIAAGVYHSTRRGWDHAWIEIYSWAALPHELLHHATGLEDTKEFRELYKRFQMRTK